LYRRACQQQTLIKSHLNINNTNYKTSISRFRKTQVFKKPNPLGFLGFGALLLFSNFFYLNEQLGSLLVDFAHQLSFYLD